jgi:SAM-dependent methyltransferase
MASALFPKGRRPSGGVCKLNYSRPSLLSRLNDRIARKIFRDRAGYGRPIPKEALDLEYRMGHWDHFFAFDELPRNLVLAGVMNHLFKRPSVLDLGCGSGRLAAVFQTYPFSRYLGVDLSSEGVARARALNLPSMDFIEGDFETWRPDSCFDAIVFNECIGYARDPAATLKSFGPHLTEGGSFFLSHFRFGNYAAQWRRMERVCSLAAATAVMSPKGQVWDIKVLRPRPASNA